MRVFRIVKKHLSNDLSGTGAKIFGGRWNSPGNSVLYTSSSTSLALLEILVHLTPSTIPNDYVFVEIEIPDDQIITTLDASILPSNWQGYKIVDFTRSIGDNWLKNNITVALKVPSATVKNQFNVLINPNHNKFSEVKIVSISETFVDTHLVNREREIIRTDPIIQKRLTEISKFAFDIFISHASEEKESIVIPLVKEINKYGLRYWFDKEQIAWGHSITKKINEGINNSRFVIAIISSSYLNKPWAMTELQSALNKQISIGKTIVLPILLGDQTKREEILDKLFLLRDSQYVVWENNPEEIVSLIMERLAKE